MKEGFRSGKLIAIKKVSKSQKKPRISAKWLCKCDCGGEKIVNESSLYSGNTTTCGCIHHLKEDIYHEKIKMKIIKNIELNEKGCWIWKGAKHRQGYGQIAYRNNPMLVHRISWMIFVGIIPEGIKVCHKCDVTSCCNPDHLFLGTQLDNVKDCKNKGRFTRNIPKTRRIKLNWEQVQEVKKLNEEGMTRKEIEKKFNVSQTCIAKILTNRSWNVNWTEEL